MALEEMVKYISKNLILLQGDAWICMELMETSLDILYKLVYGKLGQAIPENILGVIALAVSTFQFSK